MNILRLALACLVILPLYSQSEIISLSESDLEKLDIVFALTKATDSASGAKLPGTVMASPDANANITSLYDGIVESWLANSGEAVTANQVLATVRSQSFMNLQQQWITSNADYEQSLFDLKKDAMLFEKGIISEQQLQATRREQAKAQAQFNSANSGLLMLGAGEQEFTALRQGKAQLGIYSLRTPVTGILTHRAFQVGEYIKANAVLASVRMPNALWARMLAPTHLAAGIEIGQKIGIENSDETLTVRKKDFEIDPLTQTIDVFAEFDQPTQKMPGQILSMKLPPATAGVILPSSAVVHTGKDTLVYVKTSAGIEPRRVSLIAAGNTYIASSGIARGENVVVRGAAVLKGIQLGLGGAE